MVTTVLSITILYHFVIFSEGYTMATQCFLFLYLPIICVMRPTDYAISTASFFFFAYQSFCYYFPHRLHYGKPRRVHFVPIVIFLVIFPKGYTMANPREFTFACQSFYCYFPHRLHYGKPRRVFLHFRLSSDLCCYFFLQITLWQTTASFSPLSPFQ